MTRQLRTLILNSLFGKEYSFKSECSDIAARANKAGKKAFLDKS